MEVLGLVGFPVDETTGFLGLKAVEQTTLGYAWHSAFDPQKCCC